MSRRSICSGNISFGMVNVPVKVYSSSSPNDFEFNLLSPKTGNKLSQKLFDSITGEEVSRVDAVSGHEYSKGEYVSFTKEEIESNHSNSTDMIGVHEFVANSKIGQFRVKKYYYLSPTRGGDKAYRLLNAVLKRSKNSAVATWSFRKKEHLVAIMAYKDGLVLAQLWYEDELHKFESECQNVDVSEEEIQLGISLAEKMTSDQKMDKYYNKFNRNMYSLLNQKVSGSSKDMTAALKVAVKRAS